MQEISKYSEEKALNLGLKDRKILFELDFNSRISYSRLGKKVGLSKQGAEYKVNNLIKKGLIKGFYPVINVPKLGFFYCRLFLTLQNITKEKQKEIVKQLINNKKVFWLFELQGPYDLAVVIWAKTITEFKDFVESLENEFGKYIKRETGAITTDVIHFQHRYLLNIRKTKEIHIKETSERIKIDKLDKKILGCLCGEARSSLVKVADKLNESPKVIAYRIKKMEEKKLIEGYRPIINHNKIGYTYYKVLINLNKESAQKLSKLKAHIKNNPLVIYIVEGVGLSADLDIEIMVKSNQQLFDFIEDLKFKFPALIGEYQTIVLMDTLKVKYLPF